MHQDGSFNEDIKGVCATTTSSSVAKVKSKKAFRTYKQAISYLFERTDYERQSILRYNVTTFNLDRMKKLLSLVGNPHKKIATVHIAGTKGKGSTCTMLAKNARSQRLQGRTLHFAACCFTARAHHGQFDNDKRIRNARPDQSHLRPVEKMAKTNDTPTFFEIMTAMAFMHFVDKEIDIAVIETGLGGRLDSTNVIEPKVVGITSLSIDHSSSLATRSS